MTTTPLLEVEDLRLAYRGRSGTVEAVRGVAFQIAPGERVALVGESGSGKSTIASRIIGLQARSLETTAGSIRFQGRELLDAKPRALRHVRGREIGYVPQDPTVSLNPVKRIGEQVAEVLLLHRLEHRRLVHDCVLEALRDAGIDDPELRAGQYPHELSGGLRQRVLIAIALIASPALLIADEPTSALDVTVQKRILDRLDEQVAAGGLAQLFITHDLGVAADRTDRILVLRHGELVEQGTPDEVLGAPKHPYTQQLVDDAPSLHAVRRTHTAPRDGVELEKVDEAPEVLRLEGIVKEFPLPRGAGGGAFRAVDDLSLTVRRGHTTGLVGESGSGKTTTGRIALRLEAATAGRVLLGGEDITEWRGERLRHLRRRVQIVQQNPYAALNPRMSIAQIVAEPLASFGLDDRRRRARKAAELIDRVALPATVLRRSPGELSGGQRQRVAIARALSLEPEFLLLDEPVSALDVTVQAQILDLLIELQHETGISYLFISHDLAVVRDLAHEVTVMRNGRVVEQGPTEALFEHPSAAYTRELLDAIPGGGREREAVG
ncbi:ABC transporter ATP-binding protein [Pseudoclavibacter chungangensis]|uniref:ABC transporter ATP-binding protein n=1 Tax=Pseudoclavibacter chungangensis TaxID=587635 RepID=A0A7J5BYQ5_9MICO|nr:ABC transporter ATP-binding protein [Pseudoclavibacter chungangensis]KAB1659428.1 ABC transporter ATP-binding protein [Pseudoclavibacter chungangensis]NYJ67724.1 peptide/nickel transport system ATP-binding protein [Pseudoclavibacter chungangensis]